MSDNGFILTTHSPRHPLLIALLERGERIVRVDDFRSIGAQSLPGCKGYFGNLFSEIRQLSSFWRIRRLLRAQRVPYVFWNRDAPWNVGIRPWRALMLRRLRPVDLYLAHSRQTADWFAPVCHYFPNAASRDFLIGTDLSALRDELGYQHDVCFIGAVGNMEYRASRERLEFLKALELRLRQGRPGLRFRVVDTASEKPDIPSQARLIRSSKINLNLGAICDLPGVPSWGLPERAFGIPGCGGFLLTEHRQCIPETFADDACDSFVGLDDCVRKIDLYLNNFPILRQRAEALHVQVRELHSYDRRACTLLELLRAWSANGSEQYQCAASQSAPTPTSTTSGTDSLST